MSDRVYRAVNALGRGVLRALDVRVRVEGAHHLPTTGPVLLAVNHVSYPDFVLVERAAVERGRFVRFMCRHDVWDHRPVAWAMDRMRHIPVDREAPAAAYLRARTLLRDGQAVGAFPEAGISYSYTIRPLMRGVASLARQTGVPVLPVVVWGGQRIWSVGRPVDGRQPGPSLRRGRVVDVRFGEPRYAAPGDDLTEWTQGLGRHLTALLEGVQRLPEHRPAVGEHAPWYPHHLGGHAPDRHEATPLDVVPRSAVWPTWGPSSPPRPDPSASAPPAPG
jgi:1-acyl-sn-glycerol-3-phosphate acyltransferase